MKIKTVLVLNGEDLVNKLSLPKHYKFSGAFYNTFEKLVELTFDIEEEVKKEEKSDTIIRYNCCKCGVACMEHIPKFSKAGVCKDCFRLLPTS